MSADRPTVYRSLGPGPSCRRPDCGADCAFAHACQSQWERAPTLSLAVPVALVVSVLLLGAAAFLG
jgi:hypothetical protein